MKTGEMMAKGHASESISFHCAVADFLFTPGAIFLYMGRRRRAPAAAQ